jgi:hypothetical protein
MANLFDAVVVLVAVVVVLVAVEHVVGPWQSFADVAAVVAVDQGLHWHEFVVAIAFEIAAVEIDIGVPFVARFYLRRQYCYSIAVIRMKHSYCHYWGGKLERMDT